MPTLNTSAWLGCELIFVPVVATTSESSGGLAALVWLAIGLGLLAVFGSLAYLIARDANRRGRNGLAWASNSSGSP